MTYWWINHLMMSYSENIFRIETLERSNFLTATCSELGNRVMAETTVAVLPKSGEDSSMSQMSFNSATETKWHIQNISSEITNVGGYFPLPVSCLKTLSGVKKCANSNQAITIIVGCYHIIPLTTIPSKRAITVNKFLNTITTTLIGARKSPQYGILRAAEWSEQRFSTSVAGHHSLKNRKIFQEAKFPRPTKWRNQRL